MASFIMLLAKFQVFLAMFSVVDFVVHLRRASHFLNFQLSSITFETLTIIIIIIIIIISSSSNNNVANEDAFG